VDGLFAQNQFEYVYHLAAYAAEGLSHFIKRFNYENNLIGSVNLINASINSGVQVLCIHLVHCRLWRSPELPMTEETPPTRRPLRHRQASG
jgi:UDP-glucose 4-epimerase